MKAFKALYEYVIYDQLIVLGCFLITWLVRDSSHNILWPLLGIFIGFAVEIVGLLRFRVSRKTFTIKASFLISATIAILSIFYHSLMGMAVGVIALSMAYVSFEQIRERRMLTWDNVRNEN